jgi:hypothetical protein
MVLKVILFLFEIELPEIMFIREVLKYYSNCTQNFYKSISASRSFNIKITFISKLKN